MAVGPLHDPLRFVDRLGLAAQDLDWRPQPNRGIRSGSGLRCHRSVWSQGRAVPISWIQDALDKLEAAGEVEISVESVGYRSAFIGAVLSQVPGARTSTAPLRVMLDGGTDSTGGHV